METKDRKTYLDVLRVLAALFVITIHVIEQYDELFTGGELPAMVALNTFVRPAVPIFVMISGALWLDPARKIGPRRVAAGVCRIVSAFVVWSALYAIAFNAVYLKQDARNVIIAFFRGQMHLWFLFMMACLYLLIPFFRRISQSRRLVAYFLILSLVFTFILPVVRSLLRGGAAGVAEYISSKTYFHFTLGYAPYFLLGRFLDSTELRRPARFAIYALGLASLAASVLLTVFYEPARAQFTTSNINAFHPFILLQSAALFTFAKYGFSRLSFSDRSRAVWRFLAARMFGVYLVHLLVIKAVCRFTKLGGAPTFAALMVPIAVAATFAVSLAISAILSRIPVVNRYIV